MKNLLFLLIALFSFVTIRAQESNRIIIKSLDGRVLNTIDSLSFKDNLQSSLYYVDSITQQAYTGKAVVYYGDKRYDSLTIFDGVQHGWQKLYSLMDGKEVELIHVYFYNQNKLLYVSYPVSLKFKNKSAFGSYHAEKGRYFIEVIYKSSGKIIVKQSIQTSADKSKQKYKFSNLSELENFFRTHYQIYPYCKLAGFFGITEIQ